MNDLKEKKSERKGHYKEDKEGGKAGEVGEVNQYRLRVV